MSSVAKQELVSYLQREIAEQKRIDAAMSGAPRISEDSQVPKDSVTPPKIHMVLPADAKKRKQTKQLYTDRGTYIFISYVHHANLSYSVRLQCSNSQRRDAVIYYNCRHRRAAKGLRGNEEEFGLAQ